MKVIKNINNNFALAVDDDGNILVVRGKGIGFGNVGRKINIADVERSYYDVNEQCAKIINNISEEIIDVATLIVDKARQQLNTPIDSGIIFTLADHINFAIQRFQKNIEMKLPIAYDVRYFYAQEMEIGQYGLNIIRDKLKFDLSDDEAVYIALHLINAEEQAENKDEMLNNSIIEGITEIIEKEYCLKINKNNFNYSRFVSHMHYLFKRGKTNHLIYSDNSAIYENLKREYQRTYVCADKINSYLSEKINLNLSDEEKMYLMLHINRLCTREDYSK